MIVRINTAVDRDRADPQLPTRLDVSVLLNSPNAQGLPNSVETPTLNRIEERIVKALAMSGCGRLVLVVTTGGVRELVCYVRDADAAMSIVTQTWGVARKLKMQHVVQPDPQWALFKKFAAST